MLALRCSVLRAAPAAQPGLLPLAGRPWLVVAARAQGFCDAPGSAAQQIQDKLAAHFAVRTRALLSCPALWRPPRRRSCRCCRWAWAWLPPPICQRHRCCACRAETAAPSAAQDGTVEVEDVSGARHTIPTPAPTRCSAPLS